MLFIGQIGQKESHQKTDEEALLHGQEIIRVARFTLLITPGGISDWPVTQRHHES